jgi:hypothetical protein
MGDDITEGDRDKPGLGGGGGVEGRLRSRSLLVGRAPQSMAGPSPAVDTRLTIGLLLAGVGTVSMLFLEKMDEAMLLSVMLCS